MKITIYNAISIDGFIARENYNTDWVSNDDWSYFKKLVKESEAIVMGRKTFETSGDDFPYNCKLNIVMTKDAQKLQQENKHDNVLFINDSPKNVVNFVRNLGYKNLLVIGGGKLNGSFLKDKLVNELVVDIHPIVIGNGVKLFNNGIFNQLLILKESIIKKSGLVILRYKISKLAG